MDFQGNGDPPSARIHTPGEMRDRFPGPIAIPAEPISGAARHVGFMANNEEPWSIDIDYSGPGGHMLTIRTVRSREHLDPYGLPVEDLPGTIVNVANRERAVDPNGAAGPGQDPEAWARQHVTESRLTRAQVAETPTTSVSVLIDGIETPGSRVDIGGRSAVMLAWGKQTVFGAGRLEIIDGLVLRSARPEDFA
jgi:hypothetical protein